MLNPFDIVRYALLAVVAAALLFAVLPGQKVPLRYIVRNLQVRWKTSLVTALAFTLVVGMLVYMLAFVQGMDVLNQSSGNPGNLLVLSDGSTDEAFSNLAGNVSIFELPQDLQNRIQKDPDGKFWATREVYVIVTHMIPGGGAGGRKRRFVQMRGIDNPDIAAKVHDLELEPGGRWWSESGVKRITYEQNGSQVEGTAYEVVLGDGVAKTFGQDKGKPKVEPGEILDIGPRKWYVVGVMKPNASTFGSEIWTHDEHIKKNFGRENSYSSFVIRAADPNEVPLAIEAIKKYQAVSLLAQSEPEYYAKLNQTNQQFRGAFLFVGFVMAIGGVMGIMNTMFAAISQRTKDIGVLRLLGFTRFQILMSFLLESLLIAFLGALLGCAIGYLVADGTTASSIMSSGPGGGKSVVLRRTVTPQILWTGIQAALMMGVIGGLVPSISAMRLRPLESLK